MRFGSSSRALSSAKRLLLFGSWFASFLGGTLSAQSVTNGPGPRPNRIGIQSVTTLFGTNDVREPLAPGPKVHFECFGRVLLQAVAGVTIGLLVWWYVIPWPLRSDIAEVRRQERRENIRNALVLTGVLVTIGLMRPCSGGS